MCLCLCRYYNYKLNDQLNITVQLDSKTIDADSKTVFSNTFIQNCFFILVSFLLLSLWWIDNINLFVVVVHLCMPKSTLPKSVIMIYLTFGREPVDEAGKLDAFATKKMMYWELNIYWYSTYFVITFISV